MRTVGGPRTASGDFRTPQRRPAAPVADVLARVAAAQAEIGSASPTRVLEVAARLALELVDGDSAAISTRDGDDIVVRALVGVAGDLAVGDHVPVRGTLASLVLRTGEAQLCTDASADPRTDAGFNAEHRIGSSVVAPLLRDGTPAGVLSVLSSRFGRFSDEHLRLVQLCADASSKRLSMALDREASERLRDALAGEELLRGAVLEALDEGILVRSVPDQQVLLSNAACDRMLGYGHDGIGQVFQRPGWRVLREDGDDFPREERPSAVTARTGLPCRERVMGIEDPDGVVRWLSATALPVHHPITGELSRVVTRFVDVTDRRRGQQALARSEQRLSAAQSITGLAWWEFDAVADRHTWSPQMFALVGLSPDVEAPGLAGFLALLHPEDRCRVAAAGRSGTWHDGRGRVFRVVLPDGSTRVLQSWSTEERGPDGSLVSVFGTTLDVTDREHSAAALRDSEEQFRVAFEGAPIGMTMVSLRDADAGRLLRANAAFCALLGIDGNGMDRLRFQDWTHPDDVEESAARLHGFVEGSVDSMSYEKRYRRADGTYVHAWVSSAVTRGDDGRPLYLFSHVVDVTEREKAVRTVADSEQQFRVAFDKSPIGMTMVGLADGGPGRVLRANRAVCDLLGYTHAEMMNLRLADWTQPEDLDFDTERLRRIVDGSVDSLGYEKRYRHKDGSTVHAWVTSAVTRGDEGQPLYLFSHIIDVTEREAAARSVAASEHMFRVAFDNAATGMTLTSLNPQSMGLVVRANAAVAQMLGCDIGDVLGGPTTRWMHPDDVPASQAYLADLVGGRVEPAPVERRFVHAGGHIVHANLTSALLDDSGSGGPYVLTHIVDVTAQRAHRQELERLAHTDTLTGLANRTALDAVVTRALSDPAHDADLIALLLLDLDRFKLVNDSLGHHVGDRLLIEAARRLRDVVGPEATVARLGGDEFVVLLTGLTAASEAGDVADRVLEHLREPYELASGHRLVSTVSLGIAVAGAGVGSRTAADLFREADLALYRAKDAGRDRRAVYDEALRARAVERLDTEFRLRRALTEDGLEVYLQPIVSLADSEPQSWEALVRVRDPDRGKLPPAAFIEVAEETGLIADLDTWVMERAVALLAAGAYPRIAVNVSGRTLEQPGWLTRLRSSLAHLGVDGDRLLVEITESTLLEANPIVDRTLAALRALGVRVGLDDFGTGYSAMAYLQKFHLDFLKIDQSFVSQLGSSPRAEATVRAVVDLAHAHDLVVTAEGVETSAQADVLREMGCDLGQGWLFGRPAPPASV